MSTICVIVDKVESILVIDGSEMSLSNSQAHSISKALTKRPCGDFNAYLSSKLAGALNKLESAVMLTIRVICLGMARGFRINLAESFQVIH